MTVLRRSAARWWLWLSGVALLGFAAMTTWMYGVAGPTALDAGCAATVSAIRTPALSVTASLLTVLGSPLVVAVVTITATISLWWRTAGLLLPLALAVTVLETACVVYLTKLVVGRPRPPVAGLVGTPAADGSFPSGHTADGSVAYLLAAVLLGSVVGRAGVRRLGYVVASVLAVGIGLTRIYLGYHWVSDVLAGWLLALGACAAACYTVCRLRPPRVTADPTRVDLTGPRSRPGEPAPRLPR